MLRFSGRAAIGEQLRVQQRGGIELAVELLVAHVVPHQGKNAADLHLHAGGHVRVFDEDVDDADALGERVVHLAAAVVGAHVAVGDEGNDELRAGQVAGDALRPLAADLDALVVPDPVAAVVHMRNDAHHRFGIRMGIAYEYVGLVALIGFEIPHFSSPDCLYL